MIQDDFGNLVDPTHASVISDRLDAGYRRMAAIESDLAENTRATQELAAAVKDVVDFFSTMKGAFRALDMLGKLAKPLDVMTWMGSDYTVINAKPTAPAGLNVLAEIQVRR